LYPLFRSQKARQEQASGKTGEAKKVKKKYKKQVSQLATMTFDSLLAFVPSALSGVPRSLEEFQGVENSGRHPQAHRTN